MAALRHRGYFLLAAALLLLAGCSNGRGSVDEPAAQGAQAGFTLGGVVNGLEGSGLVLQNNGGGDLAIAAGGAFTFAGRVTNGAAYNVSVLSQPTGPAQSCTVTNGSGSIAGANVTNISVTCASTALFSVGGTVSGLTGGGLVLQNNGASDVTVSANGGFTFPVRLADRSPYNVTVRTHPSGQNCIVRNGAGAIAGANIANVDVSCASDRFTVGGAADGVEGSGLLLQLNGANDLPIVGNGVFAFGIGLPNGARYEIGVRRQPSNPTQLCSVANSSGFIAGGNITNVAVSCTTSAFSIGGSVSGLSGAGLVLQLNGGNDLDIPSNGTFRFDARLPSGADYRITVRTQPGNPSQTCTVANSSGVVGGANITNVRVTCASQTHSVGGAVSGLLGSGLRLQNNGGDTIAIDSNGSFVFPTELASGAAYNVTVRNQPSNPDQACTVANARGTIGGADVANILVTCSTSDFTIGGTVRDLEGSGLVLRNNGGDELSVDSNGRFTFDTALPTGARYNVTIADQPRDPTQTCTVSNGSGTVEFSNVTSIDVRCATSGFEVGGHVSDLRGSGLILQNNGGDDLAIGSNGRFRFSTRLPAGSGYNVTVARQPSNPSQTCEVRDGAGTIEDSDIRDVEVECDEDDDDDDDDD